MLTAAARTGRPAGLARGCSRPRHHRASVRVALLGASPDPAGGRVDLGHDAGVVVEQVRRVAVAEGPEDRLFTAAGPGGGTVAASR